MTCVDYIEEDEYGWTIFYACPTQPEHTVLDPQECMRTPHVCAISSEVLVPAYQGLTGGGPEDGLQGSPGSSPTINGKPEGSARFAPETLPSEQQGA